MESRNLFGEDVADEVNALTRRGGEVYFDYIRRLSLRPIASEVKLADLLDNLDPDRLSLLDNMESLSRRYFQAARIIIAMNIQELAMGSVFSRFLSV